MLFSAFRRSRVLGTNKMYGQRYRRKVRRKKKLHRAPEASYSGTEINELDFIVDYWKFLVYVGICFLGTGIVHGLLVQYGNVSTEQDFHKMFRPDSRIYLYFESLKMNTVISSPNGLTLAVAAMIVAKAMLFVTRWNISTSWMRWVVFGLAVASVSLAGIPSSTFAVCVLTGGVFIAIGGRNMKSRRPRYERDKRFSGNDTLPSVPPAEATAAAAAAAARIPTTAISHASPGQDHIVSMSPSSSSSCTSMSSTSTSTSTSSSLDSVECGCGEPHAFAISKADPKESASYPRVKLRRLSL